MVPTLFGSSVAQINLLLDTLIASFLIVGSQSWLGYTDRLPQFPLGLFGVALGTMILSRHAMSRPIPPASRALDWGLRTTLLIGLRRRCSASSCSPSRSSPPVPARPLSARTTSRWRRCRWPRCRSACRLTLVKTLAPAFCARQDTVTPVRAGIVAMVASMLLNVVFVGLLFWLWHRPEHRTMGWMQALADIPGLHVGLALSSACASYLNVGLLWRALRREGVYTAQPGWPRHLVRLAIACVAMTAVLQGGLQYWNEWTTWGEAARAWRLAALVGAGGATFAIVLVAGGWRPRDLRGP